jgi:RimJ/RimL family protein N-acetyltransferase
MAPQTRTRAAMAIVVRMNVAGNDWLVDRPEETIEADDLTMRRLAPADVETLVAAINESLDHLRPWMAWAQTPASIESMTDFVARADENWARGNEFQYLIRNAAGALVGGCGLHARQGPGVLEIGYWVHVDHLRAGIATKTAAGLTRTAFAMRPVKRVEISCDATNARSAAVPRKLGYRLVSPAAGVDRHPKETPPPIVWAIDRT